MQQLLNEIDTLKDELSSLRPLSPEAVKKIQETLNIEYTYESNRIEGNTLTLMETAFVINEGLTVSGHPMREHLEAINHAQAIEYIKDMAKGNEEINERLIKDIHAIVLQGINRENAGKYRSVPVTISGSKHMPPQPYLIEKQMEDFILEFQVMEQRGEHPVIIAAFLHERLVTIHPFIDGNGRTSRLLMNLYLIRNGYTIVNIKGDPESRFNYYKALESVQTENESDSFNKLIAEAEKESLVKYLSLVK